MGKSKRENGSTLVMIIIVFVVLAVFSTFTLSFMVTENRQSINHELKAQSYFAALSGAEVVENALIKQLDSYKTDKTLQKAFLDVYASPGKIINITAEGVKSVNVLYEAINGKNVLSITSVGEVRGVQEIVKKIIYSTESIVTSQNDGQLMVPDGQFLIYLTKGEEHQNNKNTIKDIPSAFGIKASDEQKALFTISELDVFEATLWSQLHPAVSAGKTVSGTYGSDLTTTNIYVNGSLELTGNLTFAGDVNIYVKDNLFIKKDANIIGQKVKIGEFDKNRLRIYVYNQTNKENGLTTDDKVMFDLTADIFIDSGKVDFDMHQEAELDGSIIYNGSSELIFATQSNDYDNKILTGSIYAPLATVKLGFGDLNNWKTAFKIGGKVIANEIHVYANNATQAQNFYTKSNQGKSVIPVDILENVTIRTINYKSFFND